MTQVYSKISSDSNEEAEDSNTFKKLLTSSQSSQEKRKYSVERREKEIHNYFYWNESENKSSCKIRASH